MIENTYTSRAIYGSEGENPGGCFSTIAWACLLLLIIFLSLMLGGCKTEKIVQERLVHDTCRVVKVEHDSIYYRDSVLVIERTVGDTVYITKTAERIRWRDRWRTDTTYIARTDTLVKEVTKEKKETWLQRLRHTAGDIALLILLFSLLVFIGYRFLKSD